MRLVEALADLLAIRNPELPEALGDHMTNCDGMGHGGRISVPTQEDSAIHTRKHLDRRE